MSSEGTNVEQSAAPAPEQAAENVSQAQPSPSPTPAEAQEAKDPYAGIVVESNEQRIAEEQAKAIKEQNTKGVEDVSTKPQGEEAKGDDPAPPSDNAIEAKSREQLRLEAENAVLKAESEFKQANQGKMEEPNVADFDSLDDYLEAKAEFDAASSAPELALSRDERVAIEVIKSTLDQSKDNLPADFHEKAFLHVTMVEALADLENPADVMYHLGANLNKAEELIGLSPVKRAAAIVKLGQELLAQKATTAKKEQKPVKVSNAPDPINPVNASVVKPITLAEAAKTDLKAYEHMRKAQSQGNARFGW